LFLEGAWAGDSYAAVAAQQCTGAVGCQGYYRAFYVTTSPADSSFAPPSNVTGISVAAVGAQVSADKTTIKGSLDVAGFRFKTPADADVAKALSFYFGYLGLNGTWDNSTKTGSVVGALAEVISYFSSINVYYDNDGVPGFNWNFTQTDPTKQWDVLNCAAGATNGYDAFDPNGGIDLKNLIWTPLVHTSILCNSIPALSTAPAGCEIHMLTTSGSNSTNASAAPVITIVARLASEPVLINNVLHGPDRAKFDVTIQFPWASFPQLYAPATAKLALISFGAGKSEDFAAVLKRPSDGADELSFVAAGGRSYYAYTHVALVDGQAENVTNQVITGQQILNYACPTPSPCSGVPGTTAIVGSLKLVVNWLQSFGWKSSLAFHSLGTSYQPTTIFWDPEVGASNNPTNGTNSTAPPSVSPNSTPSSAGLAVPALALLALMFH